MREVKFVLVEYEATSNLPTLSEKVIPTLSTNILKTRIHK